MKKIVVGVITLMLGIFLLFKNMGFIHYNISHLVLSWQTLLIAIGAILLFDRKASSRNAGAVLAIIGVLFLIPKIFDVRIGGIVVPLLIILAGIYFIIKATTRRNPTEFFSDKYRKENEHTSFIQSSIDPEGIVKKEYVFTGTKEKWTHGKLKGVEIDAVFSGVEVDFTHAEISDEVKMTAPIKVSAVFSGIALYVPADWNIIVQKQGAFGGFTDKRPAHVIHSSVSSRKLVNLAVEAVFGGVELKCYQ